MELTNSQLNRLYDIYFFEDDEEIISATYDTTIKQLYITYIDADECVGTYIPTCSEPEDFDKIKYILTGVKDYD